MTDIQPFLRRLPDGRWEDTRLVYQPGTRIRITGGLYGGYEAEVESLVGMVQGDGNWIPEPGYNAKLESGKYITIQWNLAEKLH